MVPTRKPAANRTRRLLLHEESPIVAAVRTNELVKCGTARQPQNRMCGTPPPMRYRRRAETSNAKQTSMRHGSTNRPDQTEMQPQTVTTLCTHVPRSLPTPPQKRQHPFTAPQGSHNITQQVMDIHSHK